MGSNLVAFDHKGYDPQLLAQLAFLIQVKALNKKIAARMDETRSVVFNLVRSSL